MIDRFKYPLEAHFVHANINGTQLAVLGILFQV